MDSTKGALRLDGKVSGELYVSATDMLHVHVSVESGDRVELRGVLYHVGAHLYRESEDAPWTLGKPGADWQSGQNAYHSLHLSRGDYKDASDAARRDVGAAIVEAMNAASDTLAPVILAGAVKYAGFGLEQARRDYDKAQEAARKALTARDEAEEALEALQRRADAPTLYLS